MTASATSCCASRRSRCGPTCCARFRTSKATPATSRSSTLRPLVRSLRALLLHSRPLRATDVALPTEAKTEPETAASLDRTRVDFLPGALANERDTAARAPAGRARCGAARRRSGRRHRPREHRRLARPHHRRLPRSRRVRAAADRARCTARECAPVSSAESSRKANVVVQRWQRLRDQFDAADAHGADARRRRGEDRPAARGGAPHLHHRDGRDGSDRRPGDHRACRPRNSRSRRGTMRCAASPKLPRPRSRACSTELQGPAAAHGLRNRGDDRRRTREADRRGSPRTFARGSRSSSRTSTHASPPSRTSSTAHDAEAAAEKRIQLLTEAGASRARRPFVLVPSFRAGTLQARGVDERVCNRATVCSTSSGRALTTRSPSTTGCTPPRA